MEVYLIDLILFLDEANSCIPAARDQADKHCPKC